MTTTHPIIHETLDAGELRRLASVRGACMTFLLPDWHPGEPSASHQTALRQLAREARTVAASANWPGEMLEPVEALVEDESLARGGPGWAIFCSTQGVECYRAPGIAQARFVVASHFHLTPLLGLAFGPWDFFLLGISRKHLRLCRFTNDVVTEIPWPEGVPASLDEAEHGRVEATGNHASTGVTPSVISSVQFGSCNRPDHEGAGHHLTHYFRMVDAGLAPTIGGHPLLLAGVAEEIAAYRDAAKCGTLMTHEITGSIEKSALSELVNPVRQAAANEFLRQGTKALEAYRAMKDPLKKLSDAWGIVRAAASGRVHQLCMRQGAQHEDVMIRELDWAKREKEDLVNAAVAETLRTGGEVFVAPENEMPHQMLVALLRY